RESRISNEIHASRPIRSLSDGWLMRSSFPASIGTWKTTAWSQETIDYMEHPPRSFRAFTEAFPLPVGSRIAMLLTVGSSLVFQGVLGTSHLGGSSPPPAPVRGSGRVGACRART